MDKPAQSQRQSGRWLKFSLRGLILLTVGVSLFLGGRASRQQEIDQSNARHDELIRELEMSRRRAQQALTQAEVARLEAKVARIDAERERMEAQLALEEAKAAAKLRAMGP